MLLLARSLLALTALLTVSGTKKNTCNHPPLQIGVTSPYHISVAIPPNSPLDGCPITIIDQCSQRGGHQVGMSVQACNNNMRGFPPLVSADMPTLQGQPISVLCQDGCPKGVTVRILQYCL